MRKALKEMSWRDSDSKLFSGSGSTCLHLTVLIHLEREATREGGRALWEQDKGGKRCRKEEL